MKITYRNDENRVQSNSKLDKKGGYLAEQSFNLPNLKYYSKEQVWNFLTEFDRTPRRLRQNELNHYKERLNYLSIFVSNINLITLKTLRDQIALLEKTFEYTVWYQPYK